MILFGTIQDRFGHDITGSLIWSLGVVDLLFKFCHALFYSGFRRNLKWKHLTFEFTSLLPPIVEGRNTDVDILCDEDRQIDPSLETNQLPEVNLPH